MVLSSVAEPTTIPSIVYGAVWLREYSKFKELHIV